ncbi:MAG: hypothetical protein K2X82_06505 [Gemmataceae bacterium]|nr:hypothetical protein [Gemmataceae bacterium]
MPAPEWLTLCWNGRPLGRITRIGLIDFPWLGGRFAGGEWPADLKIAIEWLAGQSDGEELTDPPYPEEFYEGWSVVGSDGKAHDIGPPLVDFAAGSIEWR